jgi:DNA repair protein RecN (Recombination protein N)
MLVELRAENLGIIEEILIPGAGMTAITGETGAGKTLLVDVGTAVRSRRPELVREGASEAHRRSFARPGRRRSGARAPCPSSCSRGYIDGRLAGRRTRRGGAHPGRPARHIKSLLAPAEQRSSTERAVHRGAAHAELQSADAPTTRASWAPWRRERPGEIDLLRYQLTEIDDATSPGPTRTSYSPRRGDPRRRGGAP